MTTTAPTANAHEFTDFMVKWTYQKERRCYRWSIIGLAADPDGTAIQNWQPVRGKDGKVLTYSSKSSAQRVMRRLTEEATTAKRKPITVTIDQPFPSVLLNTSINDKGVRFAPAYLQVIDRDKAVYTGWMMVVHYNPDQPQSWDVFRVNGVPKCWSVQSEVEVFIGHRIKQSNDDGKLITALRGELKNHRVVCYVGDDDPATVRVLYAPLDSMMSPSNQGDYFYLQVFSALTGWQSVLDPDGSGHSVISFDSSLDAATYAENNLEDKRNAWAQKILPPPNMPIPIPLMYRTVPHEGNANFWLVQVLYGKEWKDSTVPQLGGNARRTYNSSLEAMKFIIGECNKMPDRDEAMEMLAASVQATEGARQDRAAIEKNTQTVEAVLKEAMSDTLKCWCGGTMDQQARADLVQLLNRSVQMDLRATGWRLVRKEWLQKLAEALK